MKSLRSAMSKMSCRSRSEPGRRAGIALLRRVQVNVEPMEARLCLSGGAVSSPIPVGSGVDSIALGDVNGDQVADIAVASHQNGQYQVAIYSGIGTTDAMLATDYAPKILAKIADPFSLAAGPLNVALGDFNGDGISELAISSSDSNQISVWAFQQKPSAIADGPLNMPVTPIAMGSPFTPAGFQTAKGINLAAIDTVGDGAYQLVAAPATKGPADIKVLSYESQTGWRVTQTIGSLPVQASQGLSVAAGELTDDGMADIVVGSQATGQVAVYSEELGRWIWSISPLGQKVKNIRVAVDSSEEAAGSLVVTGIQNGPRAAILPWGGTAQNVHIASSPGAGALVPLGAGYVYRPSTIVKSTSSDSASFDYSPGPATPTVLFAATGGSQLVIQDFKPASTGLSYTPSAADTFVEPLWGNLGKGFIPLQVTSDPDATGASASTSSIDSPINLVVLPKNEDNSPFSIDLSGVPASVTAGLERITPLIASTTDPWGPSMVANQPPAVDSSTTTLALQERVIAAYASFLGVDYQHHHNPLWLPTQSLPWNITGTLAYQSQGVDCTNFTAAAYADALGIQLPGDTTIQSEIVAGNTVLEGQVAPGKNYITLPTNANGSPSSIDARINVQTFTPSDWGNTYQGLVNMLQPGDILYIDGKPGGNVTHAITWLGPFGTDSKNMYKNLIIDATGITPQHVDSNNQIIPEGVHIRPFADGNGKTPNSWYFADVDHVMRIL